MSLDDVSDSFSLNSSPFSFDGSSDEYTHDPLDFSPSFTLAGLITGSMSQIPFVSNDGTTLSYDSALTYASNVLSLEHTLQLDGGIGSQPWILYNNTGNLYLYALESGGAGYDFFLLGGGSSSGNSGHDAGNLYISGGSQTSAAGGDGGNLYIYGGTASNVGSDDGEVYISDGSGGSLLPARTTETKVVYYNTTSGLLSYGEVVSAFGSQYQIPYTNAAGDDFDYSASFTYTSGSSLLAVANANLSGSLTVDSITEYSADTGVTVDGIKLETNTPTNTIIVPSSGQSNINLNVYAKGTGLFTMGQGSSAAYIRGDSISIQDDDIILGVAGTDTILRHDPSGVGSPAGNTLTIKGGNAYAVGDNAGGDLVLWAGVGNGSGADGDIYLKQNDVYIGDGAANAYLSAQSTETAVIYYDTTTGLLSYRAHNIIDTTTVNVATYDLLTTDYILHVTYTGTAAVTSLTLPTAQCVDGRLVIIKDAGGNASVNNITVDTEGAETIDGAATAVISGDYDSITLYSNGTNWYII